MRIIQTALGHSSIQTTSLYCNVSDEQVMMAVNVV
jgi:site-specific recombinase XerD